VVPFRLSSSARGWLWPLLIALLIFVASSRSRVAGPPLPHFDKFTHFGVYGLLATLVCRQGSGWRHATWSLLAVSLYGASDEWHQYYVPGRSTELADWFADTSGAAAAIVLYRGWGRYRNLLERPLRARPAA
jgi:VanZ family protein